MSTVQMYMIECLTNLHAGSGDEAYGIIDNRIQRDPATGYPTIFSSSLKGALREYVGSNYYRGDQEQETNVNTVDDFVKRIFGSRPDERKNVNAGKYIFIGAQLISMPVRSDERPFFNTSTVDLINDFIEFTKKVSKPHPNANKLLEVIQDITAPVVLNRNGVRSPILEYETANSKIVGEDVFAEFKGLLGEYPAICPDSASALVKDNLPVIARNQLDSGESKNLWYEEVVPRFSRFYFSIITPENDSDFEKFNTIITSDIVQIGANATVGYGYCKIKKI